MSTTLTQTIQTTKAFPLRETASAEGQNKEEATEPYRYTHLLPVFSQDQYPALTPFLHVDPGRRALALPNPRSFLDNATSVVQLTPSLGTEVHGIDLVSLDANGRDQVALEVLVLQVFVASIPMFIKSSSGGP